MPGQPPFITPNRDFYRIDTALLVPQVSPDRWRLRIHGLVEHEMELSFEDLLRRPLVERVVTLSCVSNEVGGDLVGNAVWRGALLADLLDEAGIDPGATQLLSTSVDGWTCGTPGVGGHGRAGRAPGHRHERPTTPHQVTGSRCAWSSRVCTAT